MEGKTIGIIGGGQLARMLTMAAKPLGFHVVVIDTSPNCPAAQVGAEEIIAEPNDGAALRQLVARADYLTVEFEELFDLDLLEAVDSPTLPVNPAPQTLQLIKDKFVQKTFFKKQRIPVGLFAEITGLEQAETLRKKFGGKMVFKTRTGGYDGNGNAVVASLSQLRAALKRFEGRPLYAEAFVPFQKELAVMIARSLDGSTAVYPVVETVQKRNICLEVLAPAQISPAQNRAAMLIAKKVAGHLQGAGVFGLELFLLNDGKVLLNEIAPRVHNSGHYTIEACRVSQFEQHVRAVTGLPLGSTELAVPATVMINILGERRGPAILEGLDNALAAPHTSVHMYGKSLTKVDRKMGHITSTGQTVAEARKRARAARKKLNV